MLRTGGNLHLYGSPASWRASLPGWDVRGEHGLAFEHHHDRAEIASFQPGLSPMFGDATFVPGWMTVDDPKAFAEAVARAFVQSGGRLRLAEATALQSGADGVHVICSGGLEVAAPRVIVATGAWSHRLAATLGERIALETERGCNTTLPPGAFDLRRQLTFCDHGFAVTPIAGGVRVGGAVELAGLDAPPTYARADTLLAKARQFLPGLRGRRWNPMDGFSPITARLAAHDRPRPP
jgi:D-amino-acid dehydrogenase